MPTGELSRRFLDVSGELHQSLAAACDRVTLIVAGLPQRLKEVPAMTTDLRWLAEEPRPIDAHAAEAARARQETLTKPPGSLGDLEMLAIRLAGWQRRERPSVERVHITVFAGDHGITDEGVSAFPQAVTVEMLRNFARGGAAISVLARSLGASLRGRESRYREPVGRRRA